MKEKRNQADKKGDGSGAPAVSSLCPRRDAPPFQALKMVPGALLSGWPTLS